MKLYYEKQDFSLSTGKLYFQLGKEIGLKVVIMFGRLEKVFMVFLKMKNLFMLEKL